MRCGIVFTSKDELVTCSTCTVLNDIEKEKGLYSNAIDAPISVQFMRCSAAFPHEEKLVRLFEVSREGVSSVEAPAAFLFQRI